VWSVVIDTHMILPGGDVTYNLAVEASSDPITEPAPHYTKGITPPRGPGWYRGDLHSHTIHSDGKWDVPELVAAARAEGLDFVTLTDHNTVAPLPQMDSLSAPDLLTMGGIELTTYAGHALALGVRQWIDWRVNPPDGSQRSMRDIAEAVEAAGGLFVIAHPMSPGDPICTGCDWQYPDMMPGTAKLVEIWNGGWADFNEDGLALWYQWLNQGHRLRVTSGSDTHHPPLRREPAGSNVVYAESLTESAILEAIQRGHSYLSTGKPRLTLTAKVQHSTETVSGMMGDVLSGSHAEVTVEWNAPEAGDRLRFIVDGAVCDEFSPEAEGTKTWTLPITKAQWCVLEWRDRNGQMRAITNPIFFEPA